MDIDAVTRIEQEQGKGYNKITYVVRSGNDSEGDVVDGEVRVRFGLDEGHCVWVGERKSGEESVVCGGWCCVGGEKEKEKEKKKKTADLT